MKKILISGGIIILAAGLFFALKSDNGADSPNKNKVASFQVVVLDTDVSKKQAQEQEFIKIGKEAEALAGDQLRTSITGRATILQPNDSIASLGKNTTITLAAIDPAGGSKIKLESGDMWSKIKRLSGQDYEIETENMVAAVRGTAFAVRFYGSVSELLVLEGSVRAKIKDPKTGQFISGLETDVSAGFKISIDGANLPKVLSDLKLKITTTDLELGIVKDNLETLDKPFEFITASPTPTKIQIQQTITPKVVKPVVTKEPSPTPTTRPTPTPTPTPTQTLEPVYFYAPPPQTTIESVTPKELDREINPKFAINGTKLFGTKAVLLNKTNISFVVIDESTIFATASPNLAPGVYDVSIVTSANAILTLSSALTLR